MPVATALLVASAAFVVNVLVAAAFGGGTPLSRAASATCVALAFGAAAIGCATTAAWPRVEAGTVTASGSRRRPAALVAETPRLLPLPARAPIPS